ncbi:WecB/TagA/CpsF family glycosyltransferase [Rhizomicrobium electricum]|uniref:WecB/TagA/CpsF family glycosyltransferase n=1 Tax=Rhizomicrobium electricum TaxID=480070 RepID=A0ABP3PQE8_9PROT|nr:WecB/TagA/CpsF family glycosyltransferase [Rhizomicrobium electricum]NIJ46987.1 N-acetylglucosaminyldiphosphoundecaprenol N-acetyl-beta-D-mannosaminyltransferase [Rhizomicrobium electricum]
MNNPEKELGAGEPAPGRRPATANIGGLTISLSPADVVLAEVGRAIAAKECGHYVSITNSEALYHGLRRPGHGDFIRGSDFSLCDGVGVIVAGWTWGYRIRRFNGPLFQLECSRYGQSRGWRHFYYGGKEGVAEEMARRLREKYPDLNVCGIYTPPFRELTKEEDDQIVAMINQAKPDIVWVGLGLPKQEAWIASHLGRINAPWMVGVGGAFDFHSGVVPWAPYIIRKLGLEWLFRLIMQPKVRAKRLWWSAVGTAEIFFKGLFTARFLRR